MGGSSCPASRFSCKEGRCVGPPQAGEFRVGQLGVGPKLGDSGGDARLEGEVTAEQETVGGRDSCEARQDVGPRRRGHIEEERGQVRLDVKRISSGHGRVPPQVLEALGEVRQRASPVGENPADARILGQPATGDEAGGSARRLEDELEDRWPDAEGNLALAAGLYRVHEDHSTPLGKIAQERREAGVARIYAATVRVYDDALKPELVE